MFHKIIKRKKSAWKVELERAALSLSMMKNLLCHGVIVHEVKCDISSLNETLGISSSHMSNLLCHSLKIINGLNSSDVNDLYSHLYIILLKQ